MGSSDTTHLDWAPNSPPPHNAHYYLINGQKSLIVEMPDGDGIKCQPTQDLFAVVAKKQYPSNTIFDVALYTMEENFFPQISSYYIPNWHYAAYASSAYSARQIYSVTSDNRDTLKFSYQNRGHTEQSIFDRDHINTLDSATQLHMTKLAASELSKSGVYCSTAEGKSVEYSPTTNDLATLLSGQIRLAPTPHSTSSARQK